ncbi:acyltransferase family protein [Paenibacillus sp. TRM 82003]|uniref:acyltransferase family protein n=1 Tax=Kineococcus sp. TRM81007 TaxID=2925831 RepID=UPI001F587AD9|nr:acyltransferase family protein [Kineococcus sp. TRM81007]MCI2238849.1 acyltransferase family protein [Kineococcus sp. TRM81007]MCI3924254.1 acyltransferase family protein [Paenibacillus sp. TRM 82003]
MTTTTDAVSGAGRAAQGPRVAWADAAKGLAIALVVLTHATIFLGEAGHGSPLWRDLNKLLTGVRMPLFFTVSGLLAASVASRPWREVLRRRVVPSAWLFVLWLLLTTAFFTAGVWVEAGQPAGPAEFALALVRPHTELWYLYALAVFAVVARLLRPVPPPAQLAAAAVLSVTTSAGLTATGSWAWDNMAAYLVFFLAGAHGRRVLPRVVEGVGVLGTALLLVTFTLLAAAVSLLDLHLVPGLPLLRGALGVLGASAACALLVRRWPRTPLRALGRATLPVYLTHVLFIALLTTALELLVPETLPRAVRLLLPVAVTVLVVLAGVAVRRVLARVPGLLAPPDALVPSGR